TPGPAKAATASVSLTGASAANYTLSNGLIATAAAITTAPVTATITAANKQYDRTTNATVTGCTVSGVIPGETVTCTASGATFDTRQAGTSKTVTATGITLGGPNAANYSLASPTATTTANVTTLTLTPMLSAATKIYDSTTTATVSCAVTPL